MTARTHWVYRTYDIDGVCLYIGCTKNLEQRATGHRHGSPWYDLMTRCVAAGPYEQATALRIETEQIDAIQPTYNRRGVRIPVDPHPLAPNLSSAHTARFLGITERRLRKMVAHRQIRSYNVGTELQPRWIFLESDLEALTGREVA